MGDAFTDRQLVALTTFSELVKEVKDCIEYDAADAGLAKDGVPLSRGGKGAKAYSDALEVYLALAIGRSANYWSSMTPWGGGFLVQTFGLRGIPMVWDHAEGNPLSHSTGNWLGALEWIEKVIRTSLPALLNGEALQLDACEQSKSDNKLVSTDPPYYDNIGYADLSDFFYVWLRPLMRSVFPDLFATLAVPKAEELVATTSRHESQEKAEAFFLEGMTRAMARLARQAITAFPITIYYAFKQTRKKRDERSTGWETFLEAVISAGLDITGTWPIRTERTQGLKTGTNALASSVVLVCRPRLADLPVVPRREFVDTLQSELPGALRQMQTGNIAPVDLAQAAIGPGMAVFTRYSKVLDASGEEVSVRDALALINQTLDEVLAEQEGDFDADTRWALAWFEQSGFAEGDFGVAETLSKAKNTSVIGMVEAGILESGGGKVRLLRPSELPEDWDPERERRLTVWEAAHHLVRVLDQGELAAAEMMAKLGAGAEVARELAYRLYRICDQKNRSQEAQSYNALVQSWPEIARLAQGVGRPRQAALISEDGGTR